VLDRISNRFRPEGKVAGEVFLEQAGSGFDLALGPTLMQLSLRDIGSYLRLEIKHREISRLGGVVETAKEPWPTRSNRP
jgi:hypothetical protein